VIGLKLRSEASGLEAQTRGGARDQDRLAAQAGVGEVGDGRKLLLDELDEGGHGEWLSRRRSLASCAGSGAERREDSEASHVVTALSGKAKHDQDGPEKTSGRSQIEINLDLLSAPASTRVTRATRRRHCRSLRLREADASMSKPVSSRVRRLLAPSRIKSEGDEARAVRRHRPAALKAQMTAIRTHLLTEGLGEDVAARPLLWKLLLGVPADLNAKGYAALVAKGASPAYSKVVVARLPCADRTDSQ